MKSKEINKILKKASKDTIKEIKRLYDLVSVHHYNNDLEYIEIQNIQFHYNEEMTLKGIKKVGKYINIVSDNNFGVEFEISIEAMNIQDQLYILSELEWLSNSQKKKKILKLQ